MGVTCGDQSGPVGAASSIKEAFYLLRPDVHPEGTFERLWVPVRADVRFWRPPGIISKSPPLPGVRTACSWSRRRLAPLVHRSTHQHMQETVKWPSFHAFNDVGAQEKSVSNRHRTSTANCVLRPPRAAKAFWPG